MIKFILLLHFALFLYSSFGWAVEQNDLDYREIDKIEEILETNFPVSEETPTPEAEINLTHSADVKQKNDFKEIEKTFFFSDLAVIQKNYMPKSERFQYNLGIITVPSDAFFLTQGLSLRGAYHFNEAWGVEAFTSLFSSSTKAEVTNIADKQMVKVSNLVSLKSFSGISFYNNFAYGKLSIKDERVLPFELFSTGGVGMMMTSKDVSSATVHIGIGSLFSISRSRAVRVDLNFAIYQMIDDNNSSSIENSTFLAISHSWLWPNPEYR